MLKSKRLILGIAVFAALLISVGVFAATSVTGSLDFSEGGVSEGGPTDSSLATADRPTVSPKPTNGVTSTINAGDLYLSDSATATNPYTEDLRFVLSITNADELKGTYSSFIAQVNVKMLSSEVTGEAVGVGNDSDTVFLLDNVPVAPTTLVVKANGIPAAEGTDYTVNYKTGTITAMVAPPNGVAITADYWYNDPVSGTAYKQALTASGNDIADTFLILESGLHSVEFSVAGDSGGAKYKITVDDGTLRTINSSGTLNPSFNLSVREL